MSSRVSIERLGKIAAHWCSLSNRRVGPVARVFESNMSLQHIDALFSLQPAAISQPEGLVESSEFDIFACVPGAKDAEDAKGDCWDKA